MRWSAGDRGNIEDKRGDSGGGGGIPLGVGGLGIGGVIVVALLSMYTGVDFFSLLGGGSAGPTPVGTSGSSGKVAASPAEERLVDMMDAVARDAQDTWSDLLGSRYQPTKVVLFRDAIQSACGLAQFATGPFYCPGDRRSTSISASSTNCSADSARPAISRRPTCSRTRSATTCRT